MAQTDVADRRRRSSVGIFYHLAPIILFVVLAVHFYHQYSIRAFSDPLNWLNFARHFSTEFSQSRWPYGFPLFLNLCLRLAGPFYIFLINLPVLFCLYLLVRELTRLCASTSLGERESRWAGIYALILIASFDTVRMGYYLNPYRDFLSHVLLLVSLILWIRGVERNGGALCMFLSGGLLGLAYSVRETAILMVGPMMLHGLWTWKKNHGLRFIRMVVLFGLGLFIGLLPFLFQTYLTTRQLLLPPQAVKQGSLIPGVNVPQWVVIQDVLRKFGEHAVNEGKWIVLAAMLGCAAAVRRRATSVWLLMGAGALVYIVFYAFYYMFVRRYFFTVFLLASIPAGYGLAVFSTWLSRTLSRLKIPEVIAPAGLAVTMLILACLQIHGAVEPSVKFQVPHARQLQRDVRAAVPETNSFIYCRRTLCEYIRYFTGIPAYPWPTEAGEFSSPEQRLFEETVRIMHSHDHVYVVDLKRGDRLFHDAAQLKKFFDYAPHAVFTTKVYQLENTVPADAFALFRLERWSNRTVSISLPVADAGNGNVLVVDLGLPYVENPGRKWIQISVNGRPVEARQWTSAEYFILDEVTPGVLSITIESDQPVSANPFVELLPPGKPLELNFENQGIPSAINRLGGVIYPPTPAVGYPRILTDGRIELPEPLRQDSFWSAEIVFRSGQTEQRRLLHEVDFLIDDRSISSATFPRDQKVRSHVMRFSGGGDCRALVVRRKENDQDAAASRLDKSEWWRADGLELVKISLWRRDLPSGIQCALGAPEDAAVVGQGFYQREKLDARTPARWTSEFADLHLAVIKPGQAMKLRLTASDRLRPPSAPASLVRFTFNGEKILPVERRDTPRSPSLEDWVFNVPAHLVDADNVFRIECDPWVPADSRVSGDRRRLGLMITGLEFTPQ